MESCEYSNNTCVICLQDITCESYFTLTEKGCQTLIECATVYGHFNLRNHLLSSPSVVKTHDKCRKKYTDIRQLNKVSRGQFEAESAVPHKKLRSGCELFEFKRDCLYCGCPAVEDLKNSGRDVNYSVRTIELHTSVLSVCKSRDNDEWSQQVASRIQCCNDLVAEEARYHKTCHDRFHLGKTAPLRSDELRKSATRAAHRPSDVKKQNSFLMMCAWLESQTDRYLYSIAELRSKLLQSGRYSDDEVYCIKSLKVKLEERYGNHVVFVEDRGRADVVCLTKMASFVLREQWKKERAADDDETESQRIVKTAAKLIRAELRETLFSRETYPTNIDIGDEETALKFVPSLLHTMMQELVSNSVKQLAIANAIVQAARPRSVISPILFGLGVQMDHTFGSKWLIDQLARLGFSVS